jgi:hypothetical protein
MADKKIHIWAVGITITIILFLISTIVLTVIISQQEYHLVTDNYYEKDLRYQDRIETKKRTDALEQRPVIEIDRESRVCIISYPPRERYDDISGEVTFFRISDAKNDVTRPLQLNSEGRQHISVSALPLGQWIVKMTWVEQGEEFYLEQRVYLQ